MEQHSTQDPNRRCLPLAEWPEKDRCAWEAALAPGDILDGTVGAGFGWSDATRYKYYKGYGRWLTFIIHAGLVTADEAPEDRVTQDSIRAYIEELKAQDVSSWTLWSRLCELLVTLEAMFPSEDFGWLRQAVKFYQRARVDRRNKVQRIRPVNEILGWALGQMAMVNADPSMRNGDGLFRDALIVAFLCCCPIRLRNLSMIELDRHLYQTSSGFGLRFAGPETKTGQPIAMPIPECLTEPLNQYIGTVRSKLLTGRQSTWLWIARHGLPMRRRSVQAAITRTTERAFGRSINAHLFRDCAATHVALEDPSHIGIVSPLLGHLDPRTAQRHYVQANQIVAGRHVRDSVASLRKRLPKDTTGRPA